MFLKSLSFVALTIMGTILSSASLAYAGSFELKENQLFVDGQAQPQLWGAEIQYFRLRGGEGRNVPREKVIELWNKALDRAVEAKMNTVGFYIPWDFHEYAEGKFDFDGTVDEDGDGKPDFPSRDVRTWFKLVEAHGLKNVHVRPGPFINAEWGFLGFGAIPLWFHQKYPDSHTVNSKGQKTTLYSYHDPNYRIYAKRWLERVYNDVIKPYVGPGKLVTFLQIDNETNLMWQSMYNHDYGPRSVTFYREFLKSQYSNSLSALNASHQRNWASWTDIVPPRSATATRGEGQDWYRFQDETMHEYLHWVRGVWEGLGVREPTVLFTLAESYNAPSEGILPHYKFRNDPGYTGMMTVNLYPKTYETEDQTLMNNPFKTDHDVKAADSANDYYIGSKQEWVMGPEIQAGWWRGVNVTLDSRRQTYLSVLGHGMKSIYLYYFNEGQNWDTSWAKEQIEPLYRKLKADPRFEKTPHDQLPNEFWNELDQDVANQLFAGWSSRHILWQGGSQTKELYFDAPIGGDGEPRLPYKLVKEFGEKVVSPYGSFLGTAVEMTDNVCLLKDTAQHAPSRVPGINSLIMNSDWAGGLLALLFQAGINPKIIHWDIAPASELAECQLVIYQDNGYANNDIAQALRPVLAKGGVVLSFLDSGLADLLKGPTLNQSPSCSRLPAQPMEVDGTRCAVGGGLVFHARVPIYDVFNTDFYSRVHDAPERRQFMESVLQDARIEGKMRIKGGGDRVVAYARMSPDAQRFWVTAKSGQLNAYEGEIQLRAANKDFMYSVKDVFAGTTVQVSGKALQTDGFKLSLAPNGSTAFYIEPVGTKISSGK